MIVAGVDEVGRGAFAGPLVAAAVVFASGVKPLASDTKRLRIDDSKKLTKKQREIADDWIRRNALSYGIGKATPAYIDSHGLTKATFFAFRQAISNCEKKMGVKIDILLLDAFYVPKIRGIAKSQQFPFIKGDAKSESVASASIVAKVYRDKLMQEIGSKREYKKYGWERNVGYGTLLHRRAIKRYGITKFHRKLFIQDS